MADANYPMAVAAPVESPTAYPTPAQPVATAVLPPTAAPVVVAAQPVAVQPQPVVVTTAAPVVVEMQPNAAKTTTTTTVVNQVVRFGDRPVACTCNNCGQAITTQTRFRPGTLTWIIVAVLFVAGFWLCTCIPCCINECQDVDHHCPRCNNRVGTYNRLS